jgi:hypothetical protein
VAFALGRLRQDQRLHGSVTAALALLAADDGFGAWLMAQRGRLDESFELPL